MIAADFLIRNTSEVLTCAGPAPRRGPAQADARSIPGAAVAAHNGRIVFIGFESLLPHEVTLTPDATIVDAGGGAVVPGFVDAHTHVIFAGDRRGELRRRLTGASYEEIAGEGGGILSTVLATRSASESALAADTARRLAEMLRCGTTTAEAKSGYGLTTESELKMLRVIRELGGNAADRALAHLHGRARGAGRVPGPAARLHRPDRVGHDSGGGAASAWRNGAMCFARRACSRRTNRARSCTAARSAGMKLRLHADEFAASGGSLLAAEIGARSADHLIFVDEAGADGLAAAGVAATLLPIASFYLKLGRFAPARMLIHRNVAVALATDVNPGGGYSPSMPFAMTLACFGMGLTFEEALVGATINAAYALDRHDRVGSLEPGKQMDAVIVDGPAIDLIRVGAETIRAVVKKGQASSAD